MHWVVFVVIVGLVECQSNVSPGKKEVPVRIDVNDPNDLGNAIIHLCAVNFGAHKQAPSSAPFFSELVDASACNVGSGRTSAIAVSEVRYRLCL